MQQFCNLLAYFEITKSVLSKSSDDNISSSLNAGPVGWVLPHSLNSSLICQSIGSILSSIGFPEYLFSFREKKTGIGVLYILTFGLFGIGWMIDVVRYLLAAIKGERILGNRPRTFSDTDELPIVSSNLILKNGEVCHYCGPATYVKTKNVVVGYSGGSRGTSIRVMKGMSVRVGASKAAPVRGDVQERTLGVLSITNKRVVFSGNKGAFDKKFSALSAVTPYSNGIAFQFGDTQCPLECKDPEYVYGILARAVNSSEDEE